MNQAISDRGKVVTAAATGINLALGVLYSWSIFKDAIAQSVKEGAPGGFTWNLSSLNDPYAVACLCFAFGMIPAGKLQDARGPRITAMVGGLLVGAVSETSTTARCGTRRPFTGRPVRSQPRRWRRPRPRRSADRRSSP